MARQVHHFGVGHHGEVAADGRNYPALHDDLDISLGVLASGPYPRRTQQRSVRHNGSLLTSFTHMIAVHSTARVAEAGRGALLRDQVRNG
jgi:hypothetical protein